MALLDNIKIAMGISGTSRDADIAETIAAAQVDLGIAGVENISGTDDYTVNAVKMYCFSHYNFQGQGEQWEKRYQLIRNQMTLAHEYNTPVNGGEGS